VVAALDAVYIAETRSSELLALQLYFLEAVRSGRCEPILFTYGLPERAVALGRYHLYAGPKTRNGIGAYRRLTGGRISGTGEGWLGCVLILPSRDWLLPHKDPALKPEQMMNRYVRGVLAGLRALGVDGFYPGRDAVTVDRREIAICSFETDSSGAMLFETIIAVKRGLENLVYDLELLDTEGALTVPMYGTDAVTTLSREVGRDLSTEEVAKAIEAGYGTLMEVRRRELTQDEWSRAKSGSADMASGWLTSRKPDPALRLVGRERIQLGYAEAYLTLDTLGRIERLMMAGDFIANSSGLDEFEHELAGKRLDLVNVSAAVAKVYADGANYMLGLGDLTNLSRVIMKAS
jgi:lipoate-protein ligase A